VDSDDVSTPPSALNGSLLKHHHPLFKQDDVGRFLRDVDRRIHRNSHVRIPQGYRIVNAISQIPDCVAPGSEDSNNPGLLEWIHLREDLSILGKEAEFVVAHILDFVTQNDFSRVEADFTADHGSYDRIVARDDLNPNAMLIQRF